MASYLDKTGLTTLWSKMKSHVSSNYLSLQGGAVTGNISATSYSGSWGGNTIPISKGGTGATTAANARANLEITPANIGALPISGGTLTGSLTIPSKNKLTVYQIDFGSAYLYTDSNASFLGRTGPSTAYHYFQFNGSDGNLYIDGNKALHAANFTQHAISRWGDTMEGALNFKNATLNNLGNDCAFGDQDRAGSFCIKGLNDITRLRFLPYSSNDVEIGLAASGTNLWISSSVIVEGGGIMVKGNAWPGYSFANMNGATLCTFGSYSSNGSYAANFIRTYYSSSGYHDYVFNTDGTFGSKQLSLAGNTNPWIALNDTNAQHYIQVQLGNLYIGPSTGEGIVYSPSNGALYKSSNWWAYMTGYWDANTATLYFQI